MATSLVRVRVLVLLSILALALPTQGHVTPGLLTSTCGGVNTGSCSTGGHLVIGGTLMHGPDASASTLFTGMIMSLVSVPGHPEQAQYETCWFVLGAPVLCDVKGSMPYGDFLHDCYGVGAGAWGCYITHD